MNSAKQSQNLQTLQLARTTSIIRCSNIFQNLLYQLFFTSLTNTTNSLVISRIDYCNAVLAGVHDVHPRQLQRVLNAAARLSGSTTASQPHCGTLCTGYRSGNVWSLSCRCWCLIVCTTWRPAICLPASQPVADNAGRRHLRSAARGDLAVPATRTLRYGPRSFAVAGPSTWNSLPAPIRSCHRISAFRRDLKNELFTRAYH